MSSHLPASNTRIRQRRRPLSLLFVTTPRSHSALGDVAWIAAIYLLLAVYLERALGSAKLTQP
jgi:hypothetical protein